MLTNNQVFIIESILNKTYEKYGMGIVEYIGSFSEEKYARLSDVEKDFIRLKERNIIIFDNLFENIELRDCYESILHKTYILNMINRISKDGNECSIEGIYKSLSIYFNDNPSIGLGVSLQDIEFEIDDLFRKKYITGTPIETQSSIESRLIFIELTKMGIIAVSSPNKLWSNSMIDNTKPSTNINADIMNIAALSTGTGDNIGSTLNKHGSISPEILSKILDCLKFLNQSVDVVPSNHREDYEVALAEIQDFVESSNNQNSKKLKFRFNNLGKIIIQIVTIVGITTQVGLDISNNYFSLGKSLKEAGYNIEIMQIPKKN